MPFDKCNSITTKVMGLISSLFNVASSQDVPFRQPLQLQCLQHDSTKAPLFSIPFIPFWKLDAMSCRPGSSNYWAHYIKSHSEKAVNTQRKAAFAWLSTSLTHVLGYPILNYSNHAPGQVLVKIKSNSTDLCCKFCTSLLLFQLI